MNNLKKLGLTALAGSLVASTAVAGSLDVTGTAKVKYQSQGSERVSGNPWSDATTITFSGSGDLDNGMFFRTEATYTDYEDVSFTGSADADSVKNKIDAEVDALAFRISIGKAF